MVAFTVPLEIWNTTNRPLAALVDPTRPINLRPLRILLAEDSPDNCVITMAYLEDTPYQVDIAETGAIACRMFESGHYDLVLMDRQMPVMDGLTATRAIREWENAHALPPIPIIALTASALKGDREMCLAAGCTDFLTKPIKQEVLLNAIIEHTLINTPNLTDRIAIAPMVPVRMNPRILALVPAYLLDCGRTVTTLQDALDKADFVTVLFHAHNISGSGGGFGYQTISDIGMALEETARRADLDASRRWVGELSSYLSSIDRPSN
jgi:CheY-like chemotaxis protein/HPt (histidine-containing phosphotransfer) domain-containing protein